MVAIPLGRFWSRGTIARYPIKPSPFADALSETLNCTGEWCAMRLSCMPRGHGSTSVSTSSAPTLRTPVDE
jgi:hypothetical protein